MTWPTCNSGSVVSGNGPQAAYHEGRAHVGQRVDEVCTDAVEQMVHVHAQILRVVSVAKGLLESKRLGVRTGGVGELVEDDTAQAQIRRSSSRLRAR